MLKISLLLLLLGSAYAHQELSNLLLQQQKDLDLTADEVDALRPFYQELQTQHDYLYNLQLQNNDGSAQLEQQKDNQLDANYAKAFDEFRAQFVGYVSYKPSIEYDISLPTLEQILGQPSADMTEKELQEFQDLQDILQDVLDESQLGINELVKRAIDLETNMLSINKPKIVVAAIGALQTMWNVWGRGSRAAYCSYSHVPQFTEAIHAVNGGVDCYKYSMRLILQIQNETVASVKEIKRNVQGLIKIYKKIAAKRTFFGRILSGTLNVLSAIRRVHDIIAVGIDGYDKINSQLPGAASQSAQCGLNFVNSIPHMIETTQNLTVCITYVETDKSEYEFTKPETDRYWNTGDKPMDIPDENDVEGDDDKEADDADDDYVDHR